MSVLISVTVMAKTGNSRNAPYPASYTGLIGTDVIASVLPYTGPQPGVNSVIKVRYNGDRSLSYKEVYYVNESVATVKTLAG